MQRPPRHRHKRQQHHRLHPLALRVQPNPKQLNPVIQRTPKLVPDLPLQRVHKPQRLEPPQKPPLGLVPLKVRRRKLLPHPKVVYKRQKYRVQPSVLPLKTGRKNKQIVDVPQQLKHQRVAFP